MGWAMNSMDHGSIWACSPSVSKGLLNEMRYVSREIFTVNLTRFRISCENLFLAVTLRLFPERSN